MPGVLGRAASAAIGSEPFNILETIERRGREIDIGRVTGWHGVE
jgi:hypothetical protein